MLYHQVQTVNVSAALNTDTLPWKKQKEVRPPEKKHLTLSPSCFFYQQEGQLPAFEIAATETPGISSELLQSDAAVTTSLI